MQPMSNPADDLATRPLKLEQFLPYRLNVVASFVSRGLARIYGERFGLGIPEWRAIAMLGEFNRLTSRDIGDLSQMHKTKVSRAVSALEERGLVERAANKADRREAFLLLTPPGRRIYDEIAPLALAFERRLLDGISATDMKTFDSVLSTLTDRSRHLSMGFQGEDP
jgi:DNA-binding MarR family transcriptional regulator